MVCKPCVFKYRKVEEESIAPQELANDKLIVKIKETEDYLDKRELMMTKKIDLLSDSNKIIQGRQDVMHDDQNKIMNKLEDMSELISDLKADLATSSVNQMAKTPPS